jgi:hypothetical protein
MLIFLPTQRPTNRCRQQPLPFQFFSRVEIRRSPAPSVRCFQRLCQSLVVKRSVG